MWTIADDMIEAARTLGVSVARLAAEQAARIHQEATEKYGGARKSWPLWDGPSGEASLQGEDAWRAIAAFVGDAPCILFWEPRTEKDVLTFERGRDLIDVLGECHRTELYVTDSALSYLFCFNDHDFLIAWAQAADWLGRRASQR